MKCVDGGLFCNNEYMGICKICLLSKKTRMYICHIISTSVLPVTILEVSERLEEVTTSQ